MNTSRPSHRANSRRGSSLLIVFLIVTTLLITIGAVLKTMVFDKRLNRRIALAGEVRNAAEGATEIAIAELDRRASSYSSLNSTPLSGFSMPSDVKTFLASGDVTATSIAFKAGDLSDLPSKPIELLTTDPFYKPEPSDSGAGKPVILRHGYIYGKASATDKVTGATVDSYVSTLIQVREQTWLSYAIFYNLDLEFHSGSTMEIKGGVHSNANIYARAENSVRLNIYGPVTTPKKILRKLKYDATLGTHTGDVYFPVKPNTTASGDLVKMALSGEDSSRSDFQSFASAKWKGYVQDKTFGVKPFNPPGLLNYVEDDYTTTADETRNPAYAMIEPQLSKVTSDTISSHLYAGWKGEETENQKFSALSGFIIRVTAKNTGSPATLVNADGTALTMAKPGWQLVYYQCADAGRPVNRSNLPNRDGNGTPSEVIVDLSKMSTALLEVLHRAIRLVPYVDSGTAGNSALTAQSLSGLGLPADPRYAFCDSRQGYKYGNANNDGYTGAHHLLQVDLERLDAFLRYGLNVTTGVRDLTKWKNTSGDTTQVVYPVDTAYSGIVYVEMPLIPYSDAAVFARSTTDQIRPAVRTSTTAPGFGCMIINGKKLPSLPSDTSMRDDGFSLATNGPLYIRGSFNSDGSSATPASKPTENAESDTASYDPNPLAAAADAAQVWPYTYKELPALLAGDAVTILSDGYTDAKQANSPTKHNGSLENAQFTEVSAGILSGIVPTRLGVTGVGTNNQWAGGVHNFTRFLEDWGGQTYRLRGAIVCLWENEVSKAPWYQSNYTYWYGVPTRDIGYHAFFAGGKFPPGLPVLRTVRRMSVTDITASQYLAGPPKPAKAGS